MPDYLSWDIVIEILSRLRVKLLMRFKCVSKSFNYLISQDAAFKKKHLHQSNLTRAIVYSANEPNCVISCHLSSLASTDKPIEGDMIKLDLPVQLQECCNLWVRNIYNYCDGLFCMRDTIGGGGVLIWNPHTRELKRIPKCDFNREATYGLAYDSVSDDYKVLGIVKCHDLRSRYEYLHQFRIYSLKMDSAWRQIRDVCPCKQLLLCDNIAVVNGAFHWLVQDGILELVSLDITTEKFRKFALPEPLCSSSPYKIQILCTLREKLCLFSSSVYDDGALWMMEEYVVVQSLKKILHLSASCAARYRMFAMPLYLFEDGTIIIYELGSYQEIVNLYKDGRFVCKSSIDNNDTMWAYIGTETLISPHMSLEK